MTESYALSAWLFIRTLSAIYIIAFVSLATQARGLWGQRGVAPIVGFLRAVESHSGSERYWQLPSLFWASASNAAVLGFAIAGILVSLLAFAGMAQGWMLLLAFILYISYVSAGQEFLSFQWDILLLEVGFLALFAVPWNFSFGWGLALEPHWLVRFGFYAVLFKLMFLSGVVKLMSGDSSWRDLSALSYHYWTQPLPNPLSPFFHFLPFWLHKVSTLMTFVVELGVPFLIFWPRARLVSAGAFLGLSLLIFFTGNYTFFNLLTVALCMWLVPDSMWRNILPSLEISLAPANAHPIIATAIGILLALSMIWSVRMFLPEFIADKVSWPLQIAQTFYISNSYGLFANMTKSRPEIIIEGSADGTEWKEYEFYYKPGDLNRAPPVIAPLQPRLDWQMWFAALGNFQQNPWLQNLMMRLFQGAPEVLGLMRHNPFPDVPPQYLRARLYSYEFTSPGEILSSGQWWKRSFLREYSPAFRRP